MYEKKLPFDIECGVKITMEVMGGKWKSCILLHLADGPRRPSELKKAIKASSMRVLHQQLREMEFHGLVVKRTISTKPLHTEYEITATGRTLLPLIYEIQKWGDSFRPTMRRLLRLDEPD